MVTTFDQRVTDSPTKGYYPAYLFSIDLKRVYLSIALGTTQFTAHYKNFKTALDKIEVAAGILYRTHADKFPPEWESGRRNISAHSKHRRHRTYERSAISSIEYDITELPSEEKLVSDYQNMIRVYQKIVERPSLKIFLIY